MLLVSYYYFVAGWVMIPQESLLAFMKLNNSGHIQFNFHVMEDLSWTIQFGTLRHGCGQLTSNIPAKINTGIIKIMHLKHFNCHSFTS